MHIPDGFVSTPINVAMLAVSAAACGLAVRKSKGSLEERQAPLLGVTAAFIFAAQMLNFPIGGGTSGHFLGSALAFVMLGPWNACLIMSIVLIIQCLAFADGGLSALGTNIFNMGVIGGVGCYYVFKGFQWLLPRTRTGFMTAVAISSWLSVVVAAAFCALELGFSGTSPLYVVLPAMIGVHAVIGVGEALITTAILSVVISARGDLVSAYQGARGG